MRATKSIAIRAVRTLQAGAPVYAFFLPGAKVLEIADICRLERTKEGLEGFQRNAIQKHITAMVEYMNSGDVLFPNAILLALSPRATFARYRGTTPFGLTPPGVSALTSTPRLRA